MKRANNTGIVYHRNASLRKPWEARWNFGPRLCADGVVRQDIKVLGRFETSRQAHDFLDFFIIKRVPEPDVLPGISFSDVYRAFISDYVERRKNASSSAVASYRSAYGNSAMLHDMRFDEIRNRDLQEAIRSNSDKSKSTVDNQIKLFHGMYKYAIRNDIVAKDYSTGIFPQYTEKSGSIHTTFSDEEIARLWQEQEMIPLILIYTGMRAGELIDMENDNIFIQDSYMRGGIKTRASRNRIIPIHRSILPYIQDLVSPGRYLLGGNDKQGYHEFRRKWDRSMKKCGMHHLPHDARHTAATLMERYGVDHYHTMLILGHAVPDITRSIYTHVSPQTLVADINLLPAFDV